MQTSNFNTGTGLYDIDTSTIDNLTIGNLTINNQIDMTTHKIVNLANPTNSTDAVNKFYVDSVSGNSPWQVSGSDLYYNTGRVAIGSSSFTGASVLQITGSSYLNGAVDVNGNIISNVHSPTTSTDAANKSYVDNKSYPLSTILTAGNDANSNEIINIAALGMLTTPPAITTNKIYISGGKVFYNGQEVGSVPTLAAVLQQSNSAGTFNINMNSNEILSAFALQLSNNIPATITNKLYNNSGTLYFNGSPVGVAQNLQATLAIGNSTGIYDIDLNNNDIINAVSIQSATNQSLTVQAAGTGTLFLANGASNTMIIQSSGITLNQPVNLTSKNLTNFNTISADTTIATGIIQGTGNLTGLTIKAGPTILGSTLQIQAQTIDLQATNNDVRFNGFTVALPLTIRTWGWQPTAITFGSTYSRNSFEFVVSEPSWDLDNYLYLIRFSCIQPFNYQGTGGFIKYSINNTPESSSYNGRNLLSYHNVGSVSGVYSNQQDNLANLIYVPNTNTITGCIGEVEIRKYTHFFGGTSTPNAGRLSVKAYFNTSYATQAGYYQAFEGGTTHAEYFIDPLDTFSLTSFKLWGQKTNWFQSTFMGSQSLFTASLTKIPL